MQKITAKLVIALALLFCLAAQAGKEESDQTYLPVVSATELDTLSATNIRQHYPNGISIFRSNLSYGLKEKLAQLAEENYTIVYLNTNDRELQRLTKEVINKSNISRFLITAYDGNPGVFALFFPGIYSSCYEIRWKPCDLFSQETARSQHRKVTGNTEPASSLEQSRI